VKNNNKPKFLITMVANKEKRDECIENIHLSLAGSKDDKLAQVQELLWEAKTDTDVVVAEYSEVFKKTVNMGKVKLFFVSSYLRFKWHSDERFTPEPLLKFGIIINGSATTLVFSLNSEDTFFNFPKYYFDNRSLLSDRGICEMTQPHEELAKNIIWFRDKSVYDEITHIVQSEIQELNRKIGLDYFKYNMAPAKKAA